MPARLALRSQRLGALDPARHADGLELLARDIEQRTRPVAIAVRAAPDLHPGLVEIDERAQRARALLVEDGAGALEPPVRLVGTARKRAELRHRQARVDAKIAEVASECLGAQVALQHVRKVGAAEAPERLAAAADQSSVAEDTATRALDGGHRAGQGAQSILVASGEGEQHRKEGAARGTSPAQPRVVARESCISGGRAQLEPRTAVVEDFEQREFTREDNQRGVSR